VTPALAKRIVCGLAAGALLGAVGCQLNNRGTKGPVVGSPADAEAPPDERRDAAVDRAVDQTTRDAGTDSPSAEGPRPADPDAAVDVQPIDAAIDRAPDLRPVDPPRDGPVDTRPPVAMRININGPRHVGVDFPGVWTADPGEGGVCRPTNFEVDNAINGTRDDSLFQGEVYGSPVICSVGRSLPRGLYQVNLYFAEIYWGPGCPGGGPGPGARIFDIALEGTTVLSNLDLFREGRCVASPNGMGMPVIKRFMVNINDGTLDIRLNARVDNANITAIELLSAF
jgi:hypothetical protein